jgi:L-alanine-DL-glutamate epimerase-like enolase superfamily enzyme
MHAVFENPPRPVDGLFYLPQAAGLGLQINEAELAKRRVSIA